MDESLERMRKLARKFFEKVQDDKNNDDSKAIDAACKAKERQWEETLARIKSLFGQLEQVRFDVFPSTVQKFLIVTDIFVADSGAVAGI